MNSTRQNIVVRPPFQNWCKNQIFVSGTSYQGLYRGAFSLLKHKLSEYGVQICTWDLLPLEQADVILFLDLPNTFREYQSILSKIKENTIKILQILESPLLSLHAFNFENTKHFDAVLTYEYDKTVLKRKNYYHYKLPNTKRCVVSDIPFNKRKGLLFINTNRVEGLWAMRQPGLSGLPLIGKFLSGWKCHLREIKYYLYGELYSYRRRLLRAAEKYDSLYVDIYGKGWNGEQISWCPLYPNPPYQSWRGMAKISKDELASQYKFLSAIENYKGNNGYISEKIFDAFFAGTVPVYLGDENITEYIPDECFVDVRKFKSCRELLIYLKNMPEKEWQRMREAGQEFIRSEKIRPFTDEAFAERMMEVLRKVATIG